MTCFMLKPLNHKIVIPQIECHASPLIGRPRSHRHLGSQDFGLWMHLYDDNPELLITVPLKFVDVRSKAFDSSRLDNADLLFRELGLRDSCWTSLQYFKISIPALTFIHWSLNFISLLIYIYIKPLQVFHSIVMITAYERLLGWLAGGLGRIRGSVSEAKGEMHRP